MAIRENYQAASLMLSPSQSTRKYGQNLVLQQREQDQRAKLQQEQHKYNAQQQGYDRLLTWNRDAMQNEMAFRREGRQNDFQMEQQRARDFAAAKDRIGMHAQDVLKNPNLPPELANKIRNLISSKTVAMGSGFNAVQQQEFLDQYNAQLAALLSEVPAQQPPPSAQDQFDQGVVTRNGVDYIQGANGKWMPLEQSKEQQLQQQQQQKDMEQLRPKSAQDYYGANEDQFRKDLDATKKSLQAQKDNNTYKGEVTDQAAWEQMQKDYEFRQKALGKPQLGNPTAAPTLPGAPTPASPPEMRSILEAPPAAGTAAPPVPMPTVGDGGLGDAVPMPLNGDGGLGFFSDEPGASPRGRPLVDVPAPPAAGTAAPPVPMPTVGGADPAEVAMNDRLLQQHRQSRNIDPGFTQELLATAPPSQQKVKVGGKPLVVTPGALTPQETEAKQQIMAMPREQRIAALMQYDPETKGQTLEQYLENPKTKATYESMKKEGLVPTGNYREDMLAFLDEQMKHNVLNSAGQSKPDAYVGMRADDITDPKVKAEVAKMPRPKTAEEMKTIRGSYFIDPTGVIRGTNK